MIEIASDAQATKESLEIRIEAKDGCLVGATLLEPREHAIGTVLIHGATATPQRFYRSFAEGLRERGLRVVTYDYRGVGSSRPSTLLGYHATMTDWAELDARAVHEFIGTHFGGQSLAIVGHSFGGQLLGLIDEARHASGALLVGAQFGYYGNFPAPQRYAFGFLLQAIPLFTATFGFLPAEIGIGEDLPRGVADEWARWCRTEDYYISEHPEALVRLASYDRPVRAYRFTDDSYAPRRAVTALTDRLTAANVEIRSVAPEDHGGRRIGHFGFFRPRFRETLWREAADFLTDVLEGGSPRKPQRPELSSIEADMMEDLTHHGWE